MTFLRIASDNQLYDWLLLASGVPHAHIGDIEFHLNIIGLSAKFHREIQNIALEESTFDVYVSPVVDVEAVRADPFVGPTIALYQAIPEGSK